MKTVTVTDLDRLSAQAAARPRRRLNLNLHDGPDDPTQRLLNALEPGTYVRPHRHAEGRWELFAVLRGRFALLTFDPDGRVRERVELAAGHALAGEIPGATWHSVVALEPGTVMLEAKPGPYAPLDDKGFAAWAPEEGAPSAAALVRWMETAQPGDGPP